MKHDTPRIEDPRFLHLATGFLPYTCRSQSVWCDLRGPVAHCPVSDLCTQCLWPKHKNNFINSVACNWNRKYPVIISFYNLLSLGLMCRQALKGKLSWGNLLSNFVKHNSNTQSLKRCKNLFHGGNWEPGRFRPSRSEHAPHVTSSVSACETSSLLHSQTRSQRTVWKKKP